MQSAQQWRVMVATIAIASAGVFSLLLGLLETYRYSFDLYNGVGYVKDHTPLVKGVMYFAVAVLLAIGLYARNRYVYWVTLVGAGLCVAAAILLVVLMPGALIFAWEAWRGLVVVSLFIYVALLITALALCSRDVYDAMVDHTIPKKLLIAAGILGALTALWWSIFGLCLCAPTPANTEERIGYVVGDKKLVQITQCESGAVFELGELSVPIPGGWVVQEVQNDVGGANGEQQNVIESVRIAFRTDTNVLRELDVYVREKGGAMYGTGGNSGESDGGHSVYYPVSAEGEYRAVVFGSDDYEFSFGYANDVELSMVDSMIQNIQKANGCSTIEEQIKAAKKLSTEVAPYCDDFLAGMYPENGMVYRVPFRCEVSLGHDEAPVSVVFKEDGAVSVLRDGVELFAPQHEHSLYSKIEVDNDGGLLWGSFKFEDVTFDGYLDIVYGPLWGPSNRAWSYYAYDPTYKHFTSKPLLSWITYGTFDSEKRTITSAPVGAEHTNETYVWENGHYILAKEEEYVLHKEIVNDEVVEFVYLRIVRERRGDEMVEVSREVLPEYH